MKVLIYGVGLAGRQVYKEMKNKVQVIGFLDSDPDKKGRVITDGLLCLGGPDCLSEVDFDQIQITSLFFREIKKALLESQIPEEKITVNLPEEPISEIRNS